MWVISSGGRSAACKRLHSALHQWGLLGSVLPPESGGAFCRSAIKRRGTSLTWNKFTAKPAGKRFPPEFWHAPDAGVSTQLASRRHLPTCWRISRPVSLPLGSPSGQLSTAFSRAVGGLPRAGQVTTPRARSLTGAREVWKCVYCPLGDALHQSRSTTQAGCSRGPACTPCRERALFIPVVLERSHPILRVELLDQEVHHFQTVVDRFIAFGPRQQRDAEHSLGSFACQTSRPPVAIDPQRCRRTGNATPTHQTIRAWCRLAQLDQRASA